MAKIRPYDNNEAVNFDKEGYALKLDKAYEYVYTIKENEAGEKVRVRQEQMQMHFVVAFKFIKNIEKVKVKVKIESWLEVEELYSLFLNSEFDKVRKILRNKLPN